MGASINSIRRIWRDFDIRFFLCLKNTICLIIFVIDKTTIYGFSHIFVKKQDLSTQFNSVFSQLYTVVKNYLSDICRD